MRMHESLLLAADNALYKAKREGQNQVATALLVAGRDRRASRRQRQQMDFPKESEIYIAKRAAILLFIERRMAVDRSKNKPHQ